MFGCQANYSARPVLCELSHSFLFLILTSEEKGSVMNDTGLKLKEHVEELEMQIQCSPHSHLEFFVSLHPLPLLLHSDVKCSSCKRLNGAP